MNTPSHTELCGKQQQRPVSGDFVGGNTLLIESSEENYQTGSSWQEGQDNSSQLVNRRASEALFTLVSFHFKTAFKT